ncbi:MAG: hypothetical protein ACSHXF_16220 [Aquaticitalea sp.]
MKTNLLKAVVLTIAMTSYYNCSVEPADQIELTTETESYAVQQTFADPPTCSGVNPRARFVNNGTYAFDYAVYDSEGVLLIDIDGITPGTTTDWTDITSGSILFNLESGIESDQKVLHVFTDCTEISLEIDANNLLTAAVPQEVSN